MAKPAAQVKSNVKAFDNDLAIEQAVTIKSLNQFMDNATLTVSTTKGLLSKAINTDCITAIVEDGIAYGNYQIPVRFPDEKGVVQDTGEIVEVVLSCKTEDLAAAEESGLKVLLGPADFGKLFEGSVTPTAVADVNALLTHLASLPNKAAAFEVKGGKISLKLSYEHTVPGVTTVASFSPRNGFFIKLQEVVNSIKEDDIKLKSLTDWLAPRIQIAVKTGNRAKETVTP